SNGSPPLTTNHPSDVPCPLPRRIERVRVSIASPLMQPSPNGRRVGIRIVTFEACSGFTRVTARRIAQPPKVTFVTRLQPCQLPSRAARQLPDYRQLSRWNPPPLMIRAFGAHCQDQNKTTSDDQKLCAFQGTPRFRCGGWERAQHSTEGSVDPPTKRNAATLQEGKEELLDLDVPEHRGR